MRVVLDTNVELRGLLNDHSAAGQVIAALVDGRFTLVISEPLLDEASDVLARPELRRKYRKLTDATVARLLDLLRRVGEIVPIPGTLQLCRDPKDDKFIETAIQGQASIIVSYDDDLLSLSLPNIRVMTAGEFLRLLDTSDDEG